MTMDPRKLGQADRADRSRSRDKGISAASRVWSSSLALPRKCWQSLKFGRPEKSIILRIKITDSDVALVHGAFVDTARLDCCRLR